MPRVPAHLREHALGMLQGGMRTADVARAITCNVLTVRQLRQRYSETGRTADRPCSDRPRVTTPAQDRYIRTSHLRDRYRMATTTTDRVTPGTHNPSISAQTVRNRLREAGLRACRPVVRGDGRVYRRRNERYTETCTLERDRFGGGGSVMVWGGISQHHRTELFVTAGNLNAVRYREDILLPHVVPFLQAHPDMTIQHDNATSNTARSVCDFLQDRNVSVANANDLNPIEHAWDLLDRRVRARAIPPRNVRELAGALVE
uniref:Tc1-like transposase DDE domain-containing protein n=1 Tax=Oncorhynchus tshawytscha TaxID=74940 RepID=A0AAZ3PVF4_ONCTS